VFHELLVRGDASRRLVLRMLYLIEGWGLLVGSLGGGNLVGGMRRMGRD